jgi:hypothetical protein
VREKFKIHKANKMADWVENAVTEWASDLILGHFEVESIGDLTRKEIDEVIEEWEELSSYNDWLGLGFRNCICTWETENNEYV